MTGRPNERDFEDWLNKGRAIGLEPVQSSLQKDSADAAYSLGHAYAGLYYRGIRSLEDLAGLPIIHLWRMLVDTSTQADDPAAEFRAILESMADERLKLFDLDPESNPLPSSFEDLQKQYPNMPTLLAKIVVKYGLIPRVVAGIRNDELLAIRSLGKKGVDQLRHLYKT